MQRLTLLIERARRDTPTPTVQDLTNKVQEYLQVLALKALYGDASGNALSFVGGTCLRMCYDLKRYSEDLDFNLDGDAAHYDFAALVGCAERALQLRGIACASEIDTRRAVHQLNDPPRLAAGLPPHLPLDGGGGERVKMNAPSPYPLPQGERNNSGETLRQAAGSIHCYFKFEGLLFALGLSPRQNEKLHIKIEVDTNPVRATAQQRESFFVTKFDEVFPLVKHRLETLFAGKLVALMARSYAKGRDYYDLVWYLHHRVQVDIDYFNAGIAQAADLKQEPAPDPVKTERELFARLVPLVEDVTTTTLIKDVGRFLEDPSEMSWLGDYAKLFHQLVAERT